MFIDTGGFPRSEPIYGTENMPFLRSFRISKPSWAINISPLLRLGDAEWDWLGALAQP